MKELSFLIRSEGEVRDERVKCESWGRLWADAVVQFRVIWSQDRRPWCEEDGAYLLSLF